MLIFEEFNEDKYKNLFLEEGREKGRSERNKEVAVDLIREGNMSASVIAKISKLSEVYIPEAKPQLHGLRTAF